MNSVSGSNESNLGQIAFEAHCAHGGGHNIYGKTITDWNMLSPMIQDAWYQAALAVVEHVWNRQQSFIIQNLRGEVLQVIPGENVVR